jgi:NAD+ kinase
MKKFHDPDVTAQFKKFSRWLIEYDMSVLCEPNVLKDPQIKDDEDFKPIAEQLTTWDDDTKEKCLSDVDLIICIGGDGTLLYTMSMFQVLPDDIFAQKFISSIGRIPLIYQVVNDIYLCVL